MLPWIRNILCAVLIAFIACAIWYLVVTGNFSSWNELFSELGQILAVLLILGTILAIVIWILGLTRLSGSRRRDRSAIVLSYVEQAVRLNLQLPQMLIAAEASEPPWIAGRIRKVRHQLDRGSTITSALGEVPSISRRTLRLAAAAEGTGRLGPELSRLVRDEQDRHQRNIADRAYLRAYPVAMMMVIVVILGLLMTFVMPKYKQIFLDFRIPLPSLTRAVIRFTDLFDPAGWLLLAMGLILLAAIAQQLHHRTHWLGAVRWFASNRDLADICHVIAQNLAAGLPLNTAIRGASDLAIGGSLRHKLRSWADGIERGLPVRHAAQTAGMPPLIAQLTTGAEGFDFLSRYYAGKFSRLMILLRAAAIPAVVVVFGTVVAIIALTLFLPIVALIDSAGPYSQGLWKL